MIRIMIKGLFTILGDVSYEKNGSFFEFTFPDRTPITVTVIPKNKEVTSFQEVEVSNELLTILETGIYRGMSQKTELELSKVCSASSNAARRVIYLIKYCFNQIDIEDELMSCKEESWSKDGLKWTRLHRNLTLITWSTGMRSLDDDSAKWLQTYINSDYQPFLALRHLHRAQKESSPRYKWIDATIASELAIKEFLIRRKPELEPLLLEVPSPPLHKMYGAILKEYGAPPLNRDLFKSLTRGAEIRNKLLHRPKDEKIDSQKANDYVSDVGQAIKHLLNILYPNNHFSV